jgi:hypothetical protein
MSEINPDVLAQMKRLWSALNDGTVDKETANDALKKLHDILSGAAHTDPTSATEEVAEEGDAEEDHPHRKPRKKR